LKFWDGSKWAGTALNVPQEVLAAFIEQYGDQLKYRGEGTTSMGAENACWKQHQATFDVIEKAKETVKTQDPSFVMEEEKSQFEDKKDGQ